MLRHIPNHPSMVFEMAGAMERGDRAVTLQGLSLLRVPLGAQWEPWPGWQGCGAEIAPDGRGLCHGAITPSLKTLAGEGTSGFLGSAGCRQAAGRSRGFEQAGTESRHWMERLLPLVS